VSALRVRYVKAHVSNLTASILTTLPQQTSSGCGSVRTHPASSFETTAKRGDPTRSMYIRCITNQRITCLRGKGTIEQFKNTTRRSLS
jgi:hypothetical protein